MSRYRIDRLADLARQMEFTPTAARLSQLAAAESLLAEIDPSKAYPFDFLVFRITGYRPKSAVESELLTGLALQHDLGLLIESVSESLNLRSADMAEPVLSIDDAVERFNVTSKTIQRWRRRGLPARRFVFPDGKKRVGFLLSRVERFIAGEDSGVTVSPVGELEQVAMLRRANLLAKADLPPTLIAWRIGRAQGRSVIAVLHTLRKHDADHPDQAVLEQTPDELDDASKSKLLKLHRKGRTIRQIAQRVRRSRFEVYRTVLDHQLGRLTERKYRFVDDPLFHGDDAEQTLLAMTHGGELEAPSQPEDSRVPRNLPPYLRELYRVPLLTPARERALFLLLHFYKFRFDTARKRFEPQFARRRDLLALQAGFKRIIRVRNQIARANLRLVVSVARKHERPGAPLMELVSEGNLTLLRAVDAFDPHKGTRFSTYATLALMKGFARAVPQLQSRRAAGGSEDRLLELPDPAHDRSANLRLDTDHVHTLLNRLDDDERQVLLARYGLGGQADASTLSQAADRLGFSRQHVRDLEQSAFRKLRESLE